MAKFKDDPFSHRPQHRYVPMHRRAVDRPSGSLEGRMAFHRAPLRLPYIDPPCFTPATALSQGHSATMMKLSESMRRADAKRTYLCAASRGVQSQQREQPRYATCDILKGKGPQRLFAVQVPVVVREMSVEQRKGEDMLRQRVADESHRMWFIIDRRYCKKQTGSLGRSKARVFKAFAARSTA